MTAGKFRSALTALAGLAVTGVNHNYDVDAVPEKIARASLPVLIVAPALDDTRRRKFGEFQVATPSGSSALVQYMVTHLLLYAPIERTSHRQQSEPSGCNVDSSDLSLLNHQSIFAKESV
jgi:hypothetical protein